MDENHFRVDMGFPSRRFVNEFDSSTRRFNSLQCSYREPYVSDVVNILSDQFSSLSLLRSKPRPVPSLPSNLMPLRPHGLKADQRLYEGKSNLSLGTTGPFYERQKDTRVTVLQRQEVQLQKGGLVHGNGNVLKESVGTGVFHPRHFQHRPHYKTAKSLKKRNQRNRNQYEKELLTKERKGVMASTMQQQQQDECHYHLPSDIDFSKDYY